MPQVRLLIVCYYFPPAAGGGVQRVLKWCKYLPEHGVDVHVLCPDDPGWHDVDGDLTVPPNITVHRTVNRSPQSIRPAEALHGKRGLARLFTKARLLPRRLLVPDIHVRWARDAGRQGRKLHRQTPFDVVLSSSPPESSHIAGRSIARHARIPHVVDLRDSWLDLPHLRLDRRSVRLKHWINERIARRVVGNADLVTAVSEPIAVEQRRRYPALDQSDRVKTIVNGVDFDDLASLPSTERAPEDKNAFLILYTGNFFGVQSPQSLLTGLLHAAESSEAFAQHARMRFIGTLRAEDHAYIAQQPLLERMVRSAPFMPYRLVLASQHTADLLYLYIAPGPKNRAVYTGKLFEYLASQRPILAAIPHDGVAADLLARTDGHDIVNPASPDDIRDCLLARFSDWQASPGATPSIPLSQDVETFISRKGQAQQLYAYLRETVDKSYPDNPE